MTLLAAGRSTLTSLHRNGRVVSRVFADEEFDAEVEKLARTLAESPAGALAGLKALLRSSAAASFEQQLDAEARSIAGASLARWSLST